MRLLSDFKPAIFCLVLILSCGLCAGAGRRRLTSRRPSHAKPPQYQFRPRSTSPATSVVLARRTFPTTFQPYRFRPSGAAAAAKPNRFYNSGSPPPLSGAVTQREGDFRCRNAHEIFPDPKDKFLYKVCIPIGRTWILYTYKCPQGSEFTETARKCTIVPPTVATTSSTALPPLTQPNSTPRVTEVTTLKNKNNQKTEGNKKVPPPENNATEIDIEIPDNGLESLEASSSSEEEESSTNTSPEIVMPTTSIVSTTSTPTTTPEPKPVSSFIQNLLNQGIMEKPHKDRYALLTKLLMSTARPEWEKMSGYKNQFSKLTSTTSSTTPLTNRESDNVIWESLYNSENQKPTLSTSTVRSLLTRWKVVQDLVSAIPTKQSGRFPGRRPSPSILTK